MLLSNAILLIRLERTGLYFKNLTHKNISVNQDSSCTDTTKPWMHFFTSTSQTSVLQPIWPVLPAAEGKIPAKAADLPFLSCGRTTLERDSWTAPCSRRWRYSAQGDNGPQSARSWPAHPGRHDVPETGVNSGGRWTRPALKALRMAWECDSNQRRKTGLLDPDWPIVPNLFLMKYQVCRDGRGTETNVHSICKNKNRSTIGKHTTLFQTDYITSTNTLK